MNGNNASGSYKDADVVSDYNTNKKGQNQQENSTNNNKFQFKMGKAQLQQHPSNTVYGGGSIGGNSSSNKFMDFRKTFQNFNPHASNKALHDLYQNYSGGANNNATNGPYSGSTSGSHAAYTT